MLPFTGFLGLGGFPGEYVNRVKERGRNGHLGSGG